MNLCEKKQGREGERSHSIRKCLLGITTLYNLQFLKEVYYFLPLYMPHKGISRENKVQCHLGHISSPHHAQFSLFQTLESFSGQKMFYYIFEYAGKTARTKTYKYFAHHTSPGDKIPNRSSQTDDATLLRVQSLEFCIFTVM